MNTASRIAIVFAIALVVAVGAYGAWYARHRHAVMAQTARCEYQLSHPDNAPKAHAPDGTLVELLTPCRIGVTPPSLLDLLRGRIVFTDIPERMEVKPYTLWDVLLGRYAVSPRMPAPCDQSTTTDCASITAHEAQEPHGPSLATAATTTETIGNFTFSYPAEQGRLSEFGAEGVVYPGDYTLVINGITNYDLFIFTAPSPLSSINPHAATLEDYRADYPISTSSPEQMPGPDGTPISVPKTEAHILSSENVTINGIPMLRQRYSVGYWTIGQNGEQTFKSDSEADVTNELRYVFFDGKTFVVLTGWQADDWIDYVALTIHLIQ